MYKTESLCVHLKHCKSIIHMYKHIYMKSESVVTQLCLTLCKPMDYNMETSWRRRGDQWEVIQSVFPYSWAESTTILKAAPKVSS